MFASFFVKNEESQIQPKTLADALVEMREAKSPWNEILLSCITQFLSDENCYTDCFYDNYLIQKELAKDNLSSEEKKKQKAQQMYAERLKMKPQLKKIETNLISEAEDLNRQISWAEYCLEMLLEQTTPESETEISLQKKQASQDLIKKLKKDLQTIEDRLTEEFTKDITYLKLGYHYYTSESDRTPQGKRAHQVIRAFQSLKLSKHADTSLGLIEIYVQLSRIIAQREILVSPFENIVLAKVYKAYKENKLKDEVNEKQKQSKLFLLSKSIREGTAVFPANKPKNQERTPILMRSYFEIELQLLDQVITDMRKILAKSKLENEFSIEDENSETEQKISYWLACLEESTKAANAEKQLLKPFALAVEAEEKRLLM